jgi:hypothetical protein
MLRNISMSRSVKVSITDQELKCTLRYWHNMRELKLRFGQILNGLIGELVKAFAVAHGIDPSTATVLSAGLQGVVEGFRFRNRSGIDIQKHLLEKGHECFMDALITTMEAHGFELPYSATETLFNAVIPDTALLSVMNLINEPNNEFRKALKAALANIGECDTETIPLNEMASIIKEKMQVCVENDPVLLQWAQYQIIEENNSIAKENNRLLQDITYYCINLDQASSDDKSETELLEQLHFDKSTLNVFISGRWTGEPTKKTKRLVEAIGASSEAKLQGIVFHSFAGQSAITIASGYDANLRERNKDSMPEDCPFVFHYIRRTGQTDVRPRMGVAVYHNTNLQGLRDSVLSRCHAIICLGNGARCKEEVNYCNGLFRPIIPVAFAGEYARQLWVEEDRYRLNISQYCNDVTWGDLGKENHTGVESVVRILFEIKNAM